MKNRKDIAFANEENALLKDKFLFIRALYQDTTEEKSELKRQLLGRKDSFGKIFNITRKLDSVRPQEIFMQAVRVLEEVLENHSIQIYSLVKTHILPDWRLHPKKSPRPLQDPCGRRL